MTTLNKHTSELLAYTAGLIDGEGSVTIEATRRSNPNYKSPQHILMVTCTNTYRPVIEFLHEYFEASKTLRIRLRSNSKWRQCYHWNATANKAYEFLKLIRPYMQIKKDQADLAIKFQESKILKRKLIPSGTRNGRTLSVDTVNERQVMADEMHRLNKREWK